MVMKTIVKLVLGCDATLQTSGQEQCLGFRDQGLDFDSIFVILMGRQQMKLRPRRIASKFHVSENGNFDNLRVSVAR